MPASPITLNVISGIAAGKTETSELFQDAGDGYGYRNNDSQIIKIENKQGTLNIIRTGNFNGQKLKSVEILGIEQKPREIEIDGKTIENTDFDVKRKRLRFEIDDNAKQISLN